MEVATLYANDQRPSEWCSKSSGAQQLLIVTVITKEEPNCFSFNLVDPSLEGLEKALLEVLKVRGLVDSEGSSERFALWAS